MRVAAKSLSELALTAGVELAHVSTICEWERLEYGDGKHRVAASFIKCVRKNCTGFFVLLNKEKLVGYADVWELPVDFYNKLRIGTIDEESIDAAYVLSRSEVRSSHWYIGSIITDPDLRASRPVAGAMAFASICNVLPHFFRAYSEFPAKILGVGSSSFGKKLLSKWGFNSVESDPYAIDLRPRFEKSLLMPTDSDAFHLGRKEV